MADPTDRTSMNHLTDAVAQALGPNPSFVFDAINALAAIQAVLREHDLLLGPDGLLRATHVCDGDWDDDGGEDQYQASFPFACNWTDGAGEMVAGAPLFTLSPLDLPEDTP